MYTLKGIRLFIKHSRVNFIVAISILALFHYFIEFFSQRINVSGLFIFDWWMLSLTQWIVLQPFLILISRRGLLSHLHYDSNQFNLMINFSIYLYIFVYITLFSIFSTVLMPKNNVFNSFLITFLGQTCLVLIYAPIRLLLEANDKTLYLSILLITVLTLPIHLVALGALNNVFNELSANGFIKLLFGISLIEIAIFSSCIKLSQKYAIDQ